MSKYGFDYFVKRAEILNEMAGKPSAFGKGTSPSESYSKARGYMEKKYGISKGTLDKRIFGFIYHVLPDDLLTPEDQESISIAGKKSSNDFRKAVSSVVQHLLNTRELSSSEFESLVNDPDAIDQYMSSISAKTGGNRARGMNKSMEDITGIDADEYRKLVAEVGPYLREINQLRANRNSAVRRGTYNKQESAPQSPEVDYASTLMSVLEQFIELRYQLDETDYDESNLDNASAIISEIPVTEIEKTYDMYEQMVDSGVGTTKSELEQLISKIDSNPKAPKSFVAFLELLKNQADQYVPEKFTSERTYEGYDGDILDQVLDTPEKKRLFDTWYRINAKWRELKNAQREDRFISKLINANFFDDRGIEGDNAIDYSDDIRNLIAQKEELENRRDDAASKGDDATAQKYENYILHLTSTIDELKSKSSVKVESFEPDMDMMVYMTEQVYRDSFIPRKNEKFVDRGFKKPKNYWQWMDLNNI